MGMRALCSQGRFVTKPASDMGAIVTGGDWLLSELRFKVVVVVVVSARAQERQQSVKRSINQTKLIDEPEESSVSPRLGVEVHGPASVEVKSERQVTWSWGYVPRCLSFGQSLSWNQDVQDMR